MALANLPKPVLFSFAIRVTSPLSPYHWLPDTLCLHPLCMLNGAATAFMLFLMLIVFRLTARKSLRRNDRKLT